MRIQESRHRRTRGRPLYDSSAVTVEDLVRDAYWHNLPPDAYPEGLGPTTNLSNLTPDQADSYARWLAESDWGKNLDTELSDMRTGHSTSLNKVKQDLELH